MAVEARAAALQQLFESVMPGPESPLLWSVMARLRGTKSRNGLGCIPNADGSLPSSPRKSLNNLCKQFVELTKPERPIQSPADTESFVEDRLLQQRRGGARPPHCSDQWSWTSDSVQEQCQYQRNHRSAAGPDGIPPLVLKFLGPACYRALALIFSFSWQRAVLPKEWTEANVFSIVKDATKPLGDANNYRPISVTSIFIRTFEHLIHRRLTELVDSPTLPRPLLYEHQYGFRRARSCDNALHLVLSSIQDEQRRSQLRTTCLPLPVVFVDLKKAFDRVWHHQLMRTIDENFDIRGRAWHWIWRWLHCRRRIRCVSSSHHSDWHKLLDYGVPQGAVLSPLLFLLFINPIAMQIAQQCPVIRMPMFADDIAILPKTEKEFCQWWASPAAVAERREVEQEANGGAGVQAINTAVGMCAKFSMSLFWRDRCYAIQMQRALQLLSEWLLRVGMQANSSKTKLVVFTSRQAANQSWTTDEAIERRDHWYHHLELDGFRVSLARQYEYLGLLLDAGLEWTDHINGVLRRARAASNLVCRLFASLQHAPHPRAALRLVQSLVVPTISYGIHFWLLTAPCVSRHQDSVDQLHTVILRPLRMAVDLPTTTHRLGVLVDFGLPSLHDLALKSLMRYYSRYLSDSVLSEPSVRRLTSSKRRLHSGSVPGALHPAVVRLLQDAHYQASVGVTSAKNQRKWASIGARARFDAATRVSSILAESQQRPALHALPVVRQYVPLLAADAPARPGRRPPAFHPLTQPVFRFQHQQTALIAQLATFGQWLAQQAAGHARCTTAPLTQIKLQPGTTPLLRFVCNKRALATLMRLRHGRALTENVRARFPSASVSPPPPAPAPPPPQLQQQQPVETFCFFPQCRRQRVEDGVSHLTLQCPRHSDSRQQLVDQWSQHAFGRGLINTVSDLTLQLVLGEPPLAYRPAKRAECQSWFSALSDFAERIYETMAQTSPHAKPL